MTKSGGFGRQPIESKDRKARWLEVQGACFGSQLGGKSRNSRVVSDHKGGSPLAFCKHPKQSCIGSNDLLQLDERGPSKSLGQNLSRLTRANKWRMNHHARAFLEPLEVATDPSCPLDAVGGQVSQKVRTDGRLRDGVPHEKKLQVRNSGSLGVSLPQGPVPKRFQNTCGANS